MAEDNLQVQAQGALVHGQREKRSLCPSCVDARHELALMYQRPAGWGHYQQAEGVRVIDIGDDPSIPDAEKAWLETFRKQVPSMLGPSEVLIFVTKRRGEEQEIVVPHERLAALAILASSPSPIQCHCEQDCGSKATVVAPDRQGEMGLYCSPLCHMVHTNPGALAVTTTIFGARPKSEVWSGDTKFTRLGQDANATVARDWQAEMAKLVDQDYGWTESTRRQLFDLYAAADGELTLQKIADATGVSKSTVSAWFKPFRE